jgi:hypothetical protein
MGMPQSDFAAALAKATGVKVAAPKAPKADKPEAKPAPKAPKADKPEAKPAPKAPKASPAKPGKNGKKAPKASPAKPGKNGKKAPKASPAKPGKNGKKAPKGGKDKPGKNGKKAPKGGKDKPGKNGKKAPKASKPEVNTPPVKSLKALEASIKERPSEGGATYASRMDRGEKPGVAKFMIERLSKGNATKGVDKKALYEAMVKAFGPASKFQKRAEGLWITLNDYLYRNLKNRHNLEVRTAKDGGIYVKPIK